MLRELRGFSCRVRVGIQRLEVLYTKEGDARNRLPNRLGMLAFVEGTFQV
jgi:hypothetical protein